MNGRYEKGSVQISYPLSTIPADVSIIELMQHPTFFITSWIQKNLAQKSDEYLPFFQALEKMDLLIQFLNQQGMGFMCAINLKEVIFHIHLSSQEQYIKFYQYFIS